MIAPATLNTTTKWADGHQDNVALGLITEAAGRRAFETAAGSSERDLQPIVALPYLNAWQAGHTAFARSVERLRDMGVRVLRGEGGFTPHVPHTGQGKPHAFPWELAINALRSGRQPLQLQFGPPPQ